MNEKRLYVDLHVVQTVPPSCINRDDTVLKQQYMVVLQEPEFLPRHGNVL